MIVSIRSESVTKYGLTYPRSNCMPSTTSRVVSIPFASSTVITPSLPTFSIASAMSSPISASLLDEIMATEAISSRLRTCLLLFLMYSTAASTALWMPFFTYIGFEPAVTTLSPSWMIAWARIVAVVVPSPATSWVFVATSFTIWAPMFSHGSLSSISFAIVTPSFVIVGEPNFLSRMTFRPRGPSVTLTAFASWSTPALRRSRASILNLICLAISSHPFRFRELPGYRIP